MAGDWIKMRGNLWDDPRITRLCDLTGAGEAAVVGGLYWLWATADQHTENGIMPGLSIRQIDRKTGVAGLGEALVSIGWVADHPEGIRICNFEDHNGASAKKRCQTAKRVATFKSGNAEVTQQALPTNSDSVTSALPREEKRREEIKTIPDGMDGKPSKLTDPDEIIFGYGVPMLVNAGTAEKQARSFLGGLRKHHGDETLIDKLRECIKAKPLQPLEWLAAALPPGGVKPKLNKQEALEASNAAVAERFLRNNGYATQ